MDNDVIEETLNSISWEEQKMLLDETVDHNLNITAPVKPSYQLAFLKEMIKYLESEEVEIHDEIYEKLCTLQSTSSNEDELTFKHYALPKFDTTISLKESKNFVSKGTTGLCSWQAAVVLSDWLLQNASTIYEKNVLELGCGTGLCGLISSKCCRARKVIMSDGSPAVIELLIDNLNRNYSKHSIKIFEENSVLYHIDKAHEIGALLLPWENIETLSVENIIRPDIILAADVVYDSSIFQILSNALMFLFNLMENSCKLILAATVRNEETLSSFLEILGEQGFLISNEIVSNRYMFSDATIPIRIFVITRNKDLQ